MVDVGYGKEVLCFVLLLGVLILLR